MQPQVGAAIAIIQKNGGRISHVDFLDAMGFDAMDPRGSDLIKKVVYRTRHALFTNQGGYLTLKQSLGDIPDNELQEGLATLISSFRLLVKIQQNSRIWIATIVGFILGFVIGFLFSNPIIENDLSLLPLCLLSE